MCRLDLRTIIQAPKALAKGEVASDVECQHFEQSGHIGPGMLRTLDAY